MISGVLAVGYFLFSAVISFLLFFLWSRVFLRYFQISAFHPISQGILQASNRLVYPLHFVFQWLRVPAKRVDYPALTFIFLLECIKVSLTSMMGMGTVLSFGLVILFAGAECILGPCYFMFYAILVRALMSWFAPFSRHPLFELLYTITEAVLYPIRKRLPSMAGFDVSPVIAMLLFQCIILFIKASLPLQLI